MKRLRKGLAGSLFALLGLSALQAQDIDRGRGLYENQCTSCHERSVHRRESRLAKDFGALRQQVERWAINTNAGFRPDEIDAVTVYLNNLYYRHPCPDAVCIPPRARLEPALPHGRPDQ